MTAVESVPGLHLPNWQDPNSVNELLAACASVSAFQQLTHISKTIDQWLKPIREFAHNKDVHPIAGCIADCIERRDVDGFTRCLTELGELRNKAAEIIQLQRIEELLRGTTPMLLDAIKADPTATVWHNRIDDFSRAYAWARGCRWLREFLDSDLAALERRLRQLETEIERGTARLVASRAAFECFRCMTPEQIEHLMGWEKAMERYGAGTGKHAAKHLRAAQYHLQHCKDAVPAWVMPLYRVYETVEAKAGTFDVIIVDEASQCGPEALPLLFLGKQVLIIGDDKQIRPESGFVNQDVVQSLIQKFLFDFAHWDSFNIDSSIFDHADIRVRERITLREHFRCMPELIWFSNDLCYSGSPLIPLREYPPNRLEPLVTKYVPNGLREGAGQGVINRPEAEEVVKAICERCANDRYQGKTIGVIVLQGRAQARQIEQQLLECLGAEELEARRIVCGEPYSFQGDERDVIFLSMVAAPNETIGTLTKRPDERRFNVAASRARDQMWLFHSAKLDDLSEKCLRYRLLNYFTNPESRISKSLGEEAENLRRTAAESNRGIENPPHPFESWFELDVALAIASRGYRVVPQFKVADKWIDLMIEGASARLAVECDGDAWHGAEQYADDMYRQRKLERMGWQFWRVRDSAFYANREQSLNPLWRELERLHILPVG